MLMRVEVSVDLVGSLAGRGYRLVRGADFRLDPDCARAFEEFRAAWEDLPADSYLPAGGAYRRRRHSKFLLSPRGLVRLLGAGYHQSAEANPLIGGKVREFAPFREHEADNRFFRALVHHNAATFDQCARQAPPFWEVDAHLIRVTATADTQGRPSPEGRHRDGFDYITLHHVGRENVTGGRTTLYAGADGPPIAATTFCSPLDSLYADDARILHDVTPVSVAAPAAYGHRDMLLMSFKAREDLG
ncbi:2OG-Fe dioxygenase family protein [Streptomyces sp. NPDC001893]|uniref:2OG-Fe dioxygenase family protein n=1 Tax=Streptomyces sp. NPDC001893 TaxID=3154530 RepID=UPI00331F11F2